MAWFDTRLAGLAGTRYPLIQAPMAGVNTPELVAAVSNAGGLGSLGGAMLSPDVLREQLAAVRRLTDEPFARQPLRSAAGRGGRRRRRRDAGADRALARAAWTRPRHRAPVPATPVRGAARGLLADPPAVFSITFGLPPADALAALRDAGVAVVGTATTSAEAAAVEAAGCDAVAAQGSEAGGHRGTFDGRVRVGDDGHDGAGAAGPRPRRGAGDRGRRDHGRARDRGGAGARGGRRADGYGLHRLRRDARTRAATSTRSRSQRTATQ